ncbi:MAG: prepilin-type N-terminal cleavage/methylation domain-containing protein [Deltaproteobacteria bacterium]|nr:prepilin-type N-terminal cleavage/methylation domain-containing protein [Deltaproteobacteria bacterium]
MVKRGKARKLGARVACIAPHASCLGSAKGFTLIEMLVSIMITSLIVTAIYSIFRVQTHSVKIQESRLEAQEYARSVLDMMVREIRNAAYNPLGATLGADCLGLGLPGAPAVLTATSTAISFSYDFRATASGSDPDGNCDDPHEVITYQYQSPGPQSCTGGLGDITRTARPESGGGAVTEVLTDCNVPTSGLTLAYYAQSQGSPMNPVIPANIQRVQITLTVQSKNPDAQFGGQLNAQMTSNADLRNRGL